MDLNGSFTVHPMVTTLYEIVASNESGDEARCTTEVKVKVVHHELSCTIWAHPAHLSEGESTTLEWSSVGATNADISGLGPVSVQGSQSVTPLVDTTYTMTVHDEIGQTFTCSTEVTVTKQKRTIKCIVPSDMMPAEEHKGVLAGFVQGAFSSFGGFLSNLGIQNDWTDAEVQIQSGY